MTIWLCIKIFGIGIFVFMFLFGAFLCCLLYIDWRAGIKPLAYQYCLSIGFMLIGLTPFSYFFGV